MEGFFAEEIAEETPDLDDEIEEVEDEIIESVDDASPDEPEAEPEPITPTGEKESSSSDDVIRCPDCEQKLKVPYDRRPVRARCPACKCEFRALKG